MKREAFNHPKLQLLARDLHTDLCCARGVMESLWLVAQTNFPQGDVGRWTDEEIATGMGYSGDAAQLIAVLCKRKLLDVIPDADGRLYIHDWHVHAEDWVHARLARAGQTFANGENPRLRKLSHSEREKLAQERTTAHNGSRRQPSAASPSPRPIRAREAHQISSSTENAKASHAAAAAAAPNERERGIRTASSNSNSSIDAAALAKKLSRKHPQSGSVKAAAKAIEDEKLTDESEMNDSHERWEAYWAREHPPFIPNLQRWVVDGDWLKLPPDNEAEPPKKPVDRMMRLALEIEAEEAERRAGKNGRAG